MTDPSTTTGLAPSSPAMTALGHVITGAVWPRIDDAVGASRRPFDRPQIIHPQHHSRFYGSTHYGLFFPLLPEPHRYLNVMTLLGQTGSRCFDNDYLIPAGGRPRQIATLLTSTAAPDVHLYRAYSMPEECELDDDLVRFGDDLAITGRWPDYRVRVTHGELALDVRVRATDTVSWFVRNPVYDHLSLLSHYDGTLTWRGSTSAVTGLCTFEYARTFTAHSVFPGAVSPRWKLPIDFFTYQIVNLDERTQLLLTDVRTSGRSTFKALHVRTTDGRADIDTDAEFTVTEYAPEPAVGPDGHRMRLPRRLAWTVGDTLRLDGEIDTPWRYGHGKGYVGGYRFTGEYEGRSVSGRGYVEYVDCR